jgi:hypothetical protein
MRFFILFYNDTIFNFSLYCIWQEKEPNTIRNIQKQENAPNECMQ